MAAGVVKTVTGKGYGFIASDDSPGKDVFYHENSLPEGVVLREGDKVTFDIEQTPKGVNAINIALVEEE